MTNNVPIPLNDAYVNHPALTVYRNGKGLTGKVDLQRVISVDDFQCLARGFLDKALYEYVSSGTEDEQTLAENRQAFKRFFLVPRMLRDVSRVDTSLTVYGHRAAFPIFVSPAGVHALMDPAGECATARACAHLDTVMGVSQHSTKDMEEVARAAPGAPRWFQLYILKDRELTAALIKRATSAGYGAICLTVDSVRFGFREADSRNNFNGLPPGHSLANYPSEDGYNDRVKDSWDQNTEKLFDETAQWESIAWIRQHTHLPVVVKGLMSPLDAGEAVRAGADGIVVSNHGGRQLDGALSTIEALPGVVEAVKSCTPLGSAPIPVFLDSGVRRGTDVLKALALGATACLVGRPVFFSLALAGEEGVRRMLSILRDELEAAMALCGCNSLSSIDSALVLRKGHGSMYTRASL